MGTITVFWSKDRSVYRVRRSDWPNDSFEIIEWPELSSVKNVCKLLGIPFVEEGLD